MNDKAVGIVSYGVELPYNRLAVDEIIELWMNSPIDTIKKSQGVLERSVLDTDEDCNTLAVAAAREAFRRVPEAADVQALYYGTCTNPYDSRPSSTMVLEALNLPYTTKCCDLQFSLKSGTAALTHAYAMVKAGMAKKALAIGADTVNRHTAPGDLVEPYAGAGAGAVVLGSENVVAAIEDMESYSSDLSDGFRLEGERYLRTGMLLGSAKNEVGVDAHTMGAARVLFARTGLKPADFKYAVFQQTTPGFVRHCASLLGFSKEQYLPSIIADYVGDTGSASPLIGLAKVLDAAQPGDRIFLASYGYGAGADVFVLTVTDRIDSVRGKVKTVQQHIDRKKMVDYKQAMKMEFKYIRHDYPLNAYL